MSRKDPKRSRPKQSPVYLQEFFEELEQCSYFELKKEQKKALGTLTQSFGFNIEAWSFVLHPEVIKALQPTTGALKRYIFTIDTLRSRIYFRIKEFLELQTNNINSYYSGGWADFVCDAYFNEPSRNDFFASLEAALTQAGAQPLSPDNNVKNLVTIFRVEDPLILCGRTLSSFGSPSYEVIQDLLRDRVKFELIYRNYRSDEALAYFNGDEKKLVRYLKQLHDDRVFLCYDLICDYLKFVDTEYVPLCQANKAMDTVLSKIQATPELRRPIVDLLRVRLEQVTDGAEDEVTHIFINEYDFPGDRQSWKALLYGAGGDEINLYTYPLEGVLNESPIFLSDLPETLLRARNYLASSSASIPLGQMFHPSQAQGRPQLAFPFDALSGQGLTLGLPGTGKTNTDLVIAAGAAREVNTVVIVDATGGVQGKLKALSSETGQEIVRAVISDGILDEDLRKIVKSAMQLKGFSLLEPVRSMLPRVVDLLFTEIEAAPDRTAENRKREVSGFLLIEEANDAWGSGTDRRKERIQALESVLNKAWRKGWCVWLSTQATSHLGFDAASTQSILSLLRNRVLHDLGGNSEESETLLSAFKREQMTTSDLAYVSSNLAAMPAWSAVVVGSTRDSGKSKNLRPVVAEIRLLGSK